MDRRRFIRGLAAALPAGAVASQVKAESDPIRAAYLALRTVLERDAPDGMEVSDDMLISKNNLIAYAFPPNYERGEIYAVYKLNKGWSLKI